MSVLKQIAEQIDAIQDAGRQPVRIEVGARQAQAVADELSESWRLQHRLGFTWDNTAPKPIEAAQIERGDGWLFGVRVQGVESPDYLKVIADG